MSLRSHACVLLTTSLLAACAADADKPASDRTPGDDTDVDLETDAPSPDSDPPDSDEAPDVLERTATLDPGDECAFGGTLTSVGADVDRDGVLDPGEVTTREVECIDRPAWLTGPPGPDGTFTFNGRGGACGDGTDLLLQTEGPRAARLGVYRTGTFDASFTMPTSTVDLGSNPAHVLTDSHVLYVTDIDCDGVPDDPSGLQVGTLFLTQDCPLALASWDGAQGVAVTGIHVAAGATLDAFPGLVLTHDLVVEGTLRVCALADECDPTLRAQDIEVTATGTIHLRGTTPDAFIHSLGNLRNAGTIKVEAPAGTDAGVLKVSAMALWNTGTFSASATAGGGSAAAGGFLELFTGGPLRSSGHLEARGVNDKDVGGRGGSIRLTSHGEGIALSGVVDASGTCDGCTAWLYRNPFGPAIELVTYGGGIDSTATLIARDASDFGRGGVQMSLLDGLDANASLPVRPAGGLRLSGDIDLSGTDGDAMILHVVHRTRFDDDVTLALYGYPHLDLSGPGDWCPGKSPGAIRLIQACGDFALGIAPTVVLDTDITARGSGTDNVGRVQVEACDTAARAAETGVWIEGDLDLGGVRGGRIDTSTLGPTVLRGSVAAGGDAGGAGGAVSMTTSGPLLVRAQLDLSGGPAEDVGGDAGDVSLLGSRVTLEGDVSLRGGDATDQGGAGGELRLRSRNTTSTLSATHDVTGGSGATPGAAGAVILDDGP